jgi:AcrR family transcriptional regulator
MEHLAAWCSETRSVSVPKRRDRRIERTRQLLRGALVSLIQERGFEALTVQDIIDRANVGRATFYAHFDNKDDLLASGFEDLQASLRARQQEAQARGRGIDERVLAYSREMFEHANEYRDVFRAMAGRKSGAAVQRILHKLLADLIRDDVKRTVTGGGSGGVPAEAMVQFLAGGMMGLLLWWLDSRMRMPAEDVNALFRTLALPALKAVAR